MPPVAAEATALGIDSRGGWEGPDRRTGAGSPGMAARLGHLTTGSTCNGPVYDGLTSPDFIRLSRSSTTRGAAEGPPVRGRGGRSKCILFGVHQSVELQVVARRLSACAQGGAAILSSIMRGPKSKGTKFEQYPRIYMELESKEPKTVNYVLDEWKRQLQPYNWRVITEEVRSSEVIPKKGEGPRRVRSKIPDFFSENPFSPLTESPKKLQRGKFLPIDFDASIALMSVNINGVGGGRVAVLGNLARDRRVDVVAVQEHHLVDVTRITEVSGYRWFLFPARRNNSGHGHHFGGSGFLVKDSMIPFMMAEPKGNDRVAMIWFKAPGRKKPLAIGSVYAPQVKDLQEREAFFGEVARATRLSVRKGHDVALMGDFNSPMGFHPRLGSLPGAEGGCEDFVKVLESCSLFSAWVVANKDEPSPPTCTNHQGGPENTLDHILVTEGARGLVEEAEVLERCLLDSDHNPILARLSGFGARPDQPAYKTWNTQRLEEEEVQVAYYWAVEKALKELTMGKLPRPRRLRAATGAREGHREDEASATSEELFGLLLEAMEKANREVLGEKRIKKGSSARWFNRDVRAAIDARRDAYSRFKDAKKEASEGNCCKCMFPLSRCCSCLCSCSPSECSRRSVQAAEEHLKRTRAAAKAVVRKAKRKCEEGLIEELEEGTEKEFWRKVKWLNKHAATPPIAIMDDAGELKSSPEGVAEGFAQWYEKLGKGAEGEFDEEWKELVEERVARYPEEAITDEEKEVTKKLDRDFERCEIEAVCKAMKTTAAGSDKVTGLMAKVASGFCSALVSYGEDHPGAITPLFVEVVQAIGNKALKEGVFPKQGKGGRIFSIFKDGDRSDRGNYRGITLLSVIGKIITRAIANRIQGEAESRGWLPDNQGGFRPGRRTEDNALILLRALERRRQRGNGYVFFLDVTKAYDTVWRKGLLFKLHALGIRGSMYKLLANLYSGTTSTVVGGPGVESREFEIEEGVRQGDPLSCVLFNLFFSDIMEAINGATCRGMQVGKVKECKGLLFADDLVCLATSKRGMANVLKAIDGHSRKWRWTANVKKSMLMTVKAKARSDRALHDGRIMLKLHGQEVADCSHYKYLGIMVQDDLNWDKHIRRICDKARGRAGQWWTWLGKHRLRRVTKLKLYSMLVRPIMEYASAVWDADTKQAKLLEAVQNDCLRQSLPCAKSVPVVFIRADLGMASLAMRRKKLMLRYWFQMHSQANKERLAFQAFTWNLKCVQCRKCGCGPELRCRKAIKCSDCKCKRRLRRTLALDEFEELGMDQERYKSLLSPTSLSSVSHSGSDEEEERPSAYDVKCMFMQELDEKASERCLEEAKEACRKLSHPYGAGIPITEYALRYKADGWGIEGWLAGSSVGALLKFRARAGRLLTGSKWVAGQVSLQVGDPCPMCGDQSIGAEAQKHFLVRCPSRELVAERERLLAAGPFMRHFSPKDEEEEFYFALLWDTFAPRYHGGCQFGGRDAHEMQDAIQGYLMRCWEIRRRYLAGEGAESTGGVVTEPEAHVAPGVQDASPSRHSGDVTQRQGSGFHWGSLPSRQAARSTSGADQPANSANPQPTAIPFSPGAPTPPDVFGSTPSRSGDSAPDPLVPPGIAAHGTSANA